MKTNDLNSSNSFANTLKADFYKLGKMKSVYIAAAIMFGLILITFVSVVALAHLSDADSQSDILSLFGSSILFGFVKSANIELLVTIIIGIFVGKEFSNGTVRLSVARGADRLQIYFSKLISIIVLIFGYMVGSLLVCGILTAIIGYSEPFTSLIFARLMRTFGLSFVALIASASIYMMIAFLTRSSGAALGASIGIYILIEIVVSIIVLILESKGLNDTVIYFPLQQLSLCVSDQEMEVATAMKLLFMPIGYMAVSTLVGLLTFLKRDIK
ncbi:MAG: ABC transporter permease subunit [Clostridia bacterium]|nr:ABC transporter permease subunit [Clostridia bacterium]